MREVFASTVQDSRVTVAEGTFDTTGVPDASADAIVGLKDHVWDVQALENHRCVETRAARPNDADGTVGNREGHLRTRHPNDFARADESFDDMTRCLVSEREVGR